MRALVTGGGGFLGSAIARMLHGRGDEVTVLGRNRYPHVEREGIRGIQGDLRDPKAVERAAVGMDVVFHVGAIAAVWGPRSLFWDTNVGGTRNVLAACRAAGVSRLVYTSTPSVVFGRGDLCGVDESTPYPDKYLAHYPASKAIAEREVLAANGPELSTVALRPHLIWGPGDPHLIPRVLDRAARGRLVQIGDGRNQIDITYIDNAAEAHVLAADRLRPGAACAGRAYFISQGNPVALWPWLGEILSATGTRSVRRSMGYRRAYSIAAVMELAYRVLRLGGEPPLTRFVVTQLAKSHYFNIEAAERDLGYVPRVSSAEGVARLLTSLEV